MPDDRNGARPGPPAPGRRTLYTVGLVAGLLLALGESELSDAFWSVRLPSNLETTSTVSPYFQTFLASQVASGARGFLSKSITVAAMHQHSGDIHHIVLDFGEQPFPVLEGQSIGILPPGVDAMGVVGTNVKPGVFAGMFSSQRMP